MTRTTVTPMAMTRSGVGARLGTVAASHAVLDAYAGFVSPILGLLQVRCDLTKTEAAILLSLGPLVSGATQPLFAWVSDHVDSRALGAIGLAAAAAALSSIGLADGFGSLVVLFTIGMLGVAAYHPIAAASAGQLAGSRRSVGVTLFFVSGMAGATVGPIISSRVAAIEPGGFDLLRWVMIPGLVTALALHGAVRRVSHHHADARDAMRSVTDAPARWRAVALLFAGNAMRFTVSIALIYAYVRFAEATVRAETPGLDVETVATRGAVLAGSLNAMMMAGMGVGGLLAGVLVRAGREKAPMVLVPLGLAPAIVLLPFAGRHAALGLALAAGFGYAAMIPVSIAVAQRLLPHRTSLASSLMMGGAWTCATIAPLATQGLITTTGLGGAFAAIAGVLACSGLVGLLLPGALLRATAGHDGGVNGDADTVHSRP